MPDFVVVVPRPFTDAEADALQDEGAMTNAAGYAEPSAISWIPGRSVLTAADDADPAEAFVVRFVDLTLAEIQRVEVFGPY